MRSGSLSEAPKGSALPKAVRIAVLVSGDGSNLEAILKAQETGTLGGAEAVLVISSNPTAFALERARRRHIKTVVLERKDFAAEEAFQAAILVVLFNDRVDVVCLA